jgi:hypothetical protein
LLLGSTVAPVTLADDSRTLVNSCHKLVKIYATRDQQNLLAGLTTSTSEALRAGYCRGVLEEYRRTNRCLQADWLVQATRVAKYPEYAADLPATGVLLRESCEP